MKVKCLIDASDAFTSGKSYDVKYFNKDTGRVEVDNDREIPSYLLRNEYGVIEERPSEWGGEGLPPVGTECEVCVGDNDWRAACVLAVDHNIVVVRYNADWGVKFNGFSEGFYRPIKSEKDKEIEKIDDAIDEWQDEVEMMAEKSLAEHLYENGFRFVEES